MLTLPDLDKVGADDLFSVLFLNCQKVCGGDRHFLIRHLEIRELCCNYKVDWLSANSLYLPLQFSWTVSLSWPWISLKGQTTWRHAINTLSAYKHSNYHILISHTLWQTGLWPTKLSFYYRPTGPRTYYSINLDRFITYFLSYWSTKRTASIY